MITFLLIGLFFVLAVILSLLAYSANTRNRRGQSKYANQNVRVTHNTDRATGSGND